MTSIDPAKAVIRKKREEIGGVSIFKRLLQWKKEEKRRLQKVKNGTKKGGK